MKKETKKSWVNEQGIIKFDIKSIGDARSKLPNDYQTKVTTITKMKQV